MIEGKVFPVFYPIPGIFKKRKKRIEVVGLLLQRFINGDAKKISIGGFSLKAFPATIGTTALLRIVDNR